MTWVAHTLRPPVFPFQFVFSWRPPVAGPLGHSVRLMLSFEDWRPCDMTMLDSPGLFQLERMVRALWCAQDCL